MAQPSPPPPPAATAAPPSAQLPKETIVGLEKSLINLIALHKHIHRAADNACMLPFFKAASSKFFTIFSLASG